jgi:uncharacterized protein YggE
MHRVALLAIAVSAFAQTDGINTTASRTITLNPDEVTFGVTVITEFGTSMEEVLAVVQDVGITSKHLMAISSTEQYYGPEPFDRRARLLHSFNVTHPYSKLKEISGKLEAARKTLIAESGDLAWSLYVSASDKAVQDMRRQLLPQLLAEAKSNAEFMANAAGLTLGTLVSLAESSYPSGAVPYYYSGAGFYGSQPSPSPITVSYTVYVRYSTR